MVIGNSQDEASPPAGVPVAKLITASAPPTVPTPATDLSHPASSTRRRKLRLGLTLLAACLIAIPVTFALAAAWRREKLFDELAAAINCDDWPTGLRQARAAEEKLSASTAGTSLWSAIGFAYWQAGCLYDAERVAGQIPPDTADRNGLNLLTRMHLARGEVSQAVACAERLELRGCDCPGQASAVARVWEEQDRLLDAARMHRQAANLEPATGGDHRVWAEFFESHGDQPLAELMQYGSAPYATNQAGEIVLQVEINGTGRSYPLTLDTGSQRLTLSKALASGLGLEPSGSITGFDVVTKGVSEDLALAGEVRVGDVSWRNVPVDLRDWGTDSDDDHVGVIGTDLLRRARLTVELDSKVLRLEPTTGASAPGNEARFYFFPQGKIVVPIKLEGSPTLALLDTGFADDTRFGLLWSSSQAHDLKQVLDDANPALNAGRANKDTQKRIGALWEKLTLQPPPVIGITGEVLKSLAPARSPEQAKDWRLSAFGVEISTPMTRVDDLQCTFAGRTCKHVVALETPGLDRFGSGMDIHFGVLLGMNVLEQARSITVDFPRRRLWVEWAAGDRASSQDDPPSTERPPGN